MRTDLKINYNGLELVSQKIGKYKTALETIEDAVTKLKNFLETQESIAITILLEKKWETV